jgi:hypothetical protein
VTPRLALLAEAGTAAYGGPATCFRAVRWRSRMGIGRHRNATSEPEFVTQAMDLDTKRRVIAGPSAT